VGKRKTKPNPTNTSPRIRDG